MYEDKSSHLGLFRLEIHKQNSLNLDFAFYYKAYSVFEAQNNKFVL